MPQTLNFHVGGASLGKQSQDILLPQLSIHHGGTVFRRFLGDNLKDTDRLTQLWSSHWRSGRYGTGSFFRTPKFVALAFFIAASIFLSLSFSTTSTSRPGPATDEVLDYGDGTAVPSARLHLLVPATSSNLELCKLLLSITILGYPAPIFVNYGDAEDADPYAQHLSKVQGIANYLESISNDDGIENDLILVVDGYDAWFQLGPTTLLERYYTATRLLDERAIATSGEQQVLDHDIRHTILFGPDKLCWPIDFSRPACWAVPEAPLDSFAFGPETFTGPITSDYNLPLWLNSGTIMGPVADLRDLLEATLDRIHNNFTIASDQLYFADVFGAQEYARLELRPNATKHMSDMYHKGEPDPPKRSVPPSLNRTEYHIGIDYTSSIFQTVAFYRQFLTWTRPANIWKPDTKMSLFQPLFDYYQYSLPSDIETSRKPFAAMHNSTNQNTTWAEVDLCLNTATKEIPVIIHFTGDKSLRQEWWSNMWYQSSARELKNASVENHYMTEPLSQQRIADRIWYAARPEDASSVAFSGKGGAWSDTGGWFSWGNLCKAHEEELYR